MIAHTKHILSWKSKRLYDESIKPSSTSDNSLSPLIDCFRDKIRLKFKESCLKQSKLTYTHRKTINIYIVYKLVFVAFSTMIPH